MTYTFEGFFAATDQPLLETVFERWPECDGKIIVQPFRGIGVSCNKLFGKAQAIKADLPAFSELFPAVDLYGLKSNVLGEYVIIVEPFTAIIKLCFLRIGLKMLGNQKIICITY